jgi:hypothetical protein
VQRRLRRRSGYAIDFAILPTNGSHFTVPDPFR